MKKFLKQIIEQIKRYFTSGHFDIRVFYDKKKYSEFEIRTQIEFLLRRMHNEGDYSDIISFKQKNNSNSLEKEVGKH